MNISRTDWWFHAESTLLIALYRPIDMLLSKIKNNFTNLSVLWTLTIMRILLIMQSVYTVKPVCAVLTESKTRRLFFRGYVQINFVIFRLDWFAVKIKSIYSHSYIKRTHLGSQHFIQIYNQIIQKIVCPFDENEYAYLNE